MRRELIAILTVCAAILVCGCRKAAPPPPPASQSATGVVEVTVPAEVLAEIESFEALSRSKNQAEAVAAVDKLGRFAGVDVSAPLLAALADDRAAVRERAALALARSTGKEHAPRLAELLRSDTAPYVRAAAVTALGRTWACDQMPDMIAALDDADPTVRSRAMRAVARICGVEPGYEETDPVKRRALVVRFYTTFWQRYGPTVKRYHARNKR